MTCIVSIAKQDSLAVSPKMAVAQKHILKNGTLAIGTKDHTCLTLPL